MTQHALQEVRELSQVLGMLAGTYSANRGQAEAMGEKMPLHALLAVPEVRAVEHVSSYFATRTNGRPRYSGSMFETFGGGGDRIDPNRITATDLLAVSLLSVHVPAQAALGILGHLAVEIEKLLEHLPVETSFEDLTKSEFDSLLQPGAPADRLWSLLRQKEDRWGIGQTTASKILARKRPHLIPIYDSVIKERVGMPHSGQQWELWYESFIGEKNANFVDRLRRIRDESGQSHLSLLRVLDIVLWMEGTGLNPVPETIGDDE